MNKLLKQLMLIFLCASNMAFADASEHQVKEVNHLLTFVKNSGCIINRNGTEHPAEKGVQHIKNKYEYFKDKIKNTDDFIAYSATKSTMSGKYYMVSCPGKATIKAQDWLKEELRKYRLKQK